MALRDDLHKLTSLTELPVGAVEAATALDAPVGDVLDAGRSLTDGGTLRESGSGWVATEPLELSGPERAVLAGQLAAAVDVSDPGRKGRLLAMAGNNAEALPLLIEAGRGGDARAAETALELGPADPSDAGQLHLALAAHHSSRGETLVALDHATRSLPLLEGTATIDALGFIAQLHDFLQEPQAASTWGNLAAGAALNEGDLAKAGSLLTFAGRAMSRLGMAEEAANASEDGLALVEAHGSPTQKARARNNRAWVYLDHGDAMKAAAAFDSISDLAEYLGGDVEEASRYASEARALFHAGQSALGVDYFEESVRLAGDAPAPNFLAHLGFAEGATLHGMGESAVDAAERAVAITESDMNLWRNVSYLTLARAERVAGMETEAAKHLQTALDHTPAGIDGLRIRLRCEVERLAQLGDREKWPKDEAATLTDLLLQSRWYATAVELLTLRADREKGTDLGAQAVALAARIGNPLLAARAAERAGLWDKPAGAAAAELIRATDPHVAEAWRETWDSLPEVQAALAVPAGLSVAGVDDRLDQALTKAGLTGEVLSPAQRSAQGLEYSGRRTARGWVGPILGVAAAAVAVVALIIALQDGPPPPTADSTAPATTTPSTIPIVPTPENWLGGNHQHRGGPDGTGQSDGGVQTVEGYYWEPLQPGGESLTATLADGVRLFFASSTRDRVTQLSQETGTESWFAGVPGSVKIPLTLGVVELEGAAPLYVLWITEDGTVGVFNETGNEVWRKTEDELPGTSRAGAAIADGVAFVPRIEGSRGYLAAVELDSGTILWRTDQERVIEGGATDEDGEPIDLVIEPLELDPLDTTVSVRDGVVIAAPDGQRLYYLSAETGEVLCDFPQAAGLPSRPIAGEDFVAVPGSGGTIGIYPFPTCDNLEISNAIWNVDPGTSAAAAGDQLFFVANGGLIGIDLSERVLGTDGAEKLWDVVNPSADGDRWTTSPVITGNQVLVGSRGGEVAGIDIATGEILWTWQVGATIVDELAPVRGAVYATTEDGVIHALGGPELEVVGAEATTTTSTTEAPDPGDTTTSTEGGSDEGAGDTTTSTEGPSADEVAGQTGSNTAGRG